MFTCEEQWWKQPRCWTRVRQKRGSTEEAMIDDWVLNEESKSKTGPEGVVRTAIEAP